jgi:hypothetical protein
MRRRSRKGAALVVNEAPLHGTRARSWRPAGHGPSELPVVAEELKGVYCSMCTRIGWLSGRRSPRRGHLQPPLPRHCRLAFASAATVMGSLA